MSFDLRPKQKWLTVKELAKRLDCSEEAIRKRIRKGRLGTMIAGRLLVSEEEAATLPQVRRYKWKR